MRKCKKWKSLLAGAICMVLVASVLASGKATQTYAAVNAQIVSARMPFRDMTADELVAEMGTGWNLGNTMDGHTGFTPNETLWQNVETTQELIKSVHDMGFNTIRVPVTWGTMIDDENGYAIDEMWMSRVQDIVDYAMHMNMYVIINVHHDGAEQTGWLRIGAEDTAPVKEKYEAVWRHIAERFKDYDEHVIFESMNEVTGSGSSPAEDTSAIMEFNQIFVDTVRSTGSNNEARWLSVPGRYTNIAHTTDPEVGFGLPEDSAEGRLIVSVHYYDWTFGLLENLSDTTFIYENVSTLLYDFEKLKDTFTSKGIPVILGEYGAINKDNTSDRAYHMEVVARLCRLTGIVPCYWDQGWYDMSMEPDYSFTLVDRITGEQIYPEIVSAIMRGNFLDGASDLKDIEADPAVIPITDLGTVDGTYIMNMGEVTRISLDDVDKSRSNDVVLWKSNDETVATVNPYLADGGVWSANVHSTGIGSTEITAYSQSGEAVLEIPVMILGAQTQIPCTEIAAEQEEYELTLGQSVFLNAFMAPEDTDAFLTYRSSDPSIISVSKIGKIVAKGNGSAYIIITASSGLTRVVPVTVSPGEDAAEISLALNVYYNDSVHNYFSNETGSAITVGEDGQYTLSFDCDTDLSAAAGDAGVTGLSNITAIYIKDDSVTRGLLKKSPLTSCDILYDSLKVDGVEFAIHMDDAKSALKASGIFDTNDPINSWDGSVIDEVDVKDHVLNFQGLENPGKVELTFTISNLVFEEGAGTIQRAETESLEAEGAADIIVTDSSPWTLAVNAQPHDSGKITFVSSDASVVMVDNRTVEIGGDGRAVIYGEAISDGEAVVTAYAENGMTAQFRIMAERMSEQETAPTGTENNEEAGMDDSAEDNTAEDKTDSSNQGILVTAAIILGVIAMGILLFFITLKIAGGSRKKK